MRNKRAALFGSVLFSVLILTVASAMAQNPPAPNAYIDWNEVSGLPGQGTSPHGGYTTTTQKCGVCHAVHNASFMGDTLLQSPAGEACEYCHVSTDVGHKVVYDGNIDNYMGEDLGNAHNYIPGVGNTDNGVKCQQCHQVHAASNQMTENDYLTSKLLTNPGSTLDPLAGAPLSTDTSDTALSKWCAACHFSLAGTYTYWGDPDDPYRQSHTMTTATAEYAGMGSHSGGRVAWRDSNQCSSCHASEYGTSAWPHFTPGERFLVSGQNAGESVPTANSKEDGVCLRCHRSADGKGIGIDF